jgi:hypothetical protein
MVPRAHAGRGSGSAVILTVRRFVAELPSCHVPQHMAHRQFPNAITAKARFTS